MAAAMPHVKLVALLRNPIDRAYSKYRLLRRAGTENRTFADVAADQLRPEALAEARSEILPIRDTILVRGEYGRLLHTYLDRFPRDQLSVHLTDDFERDPQATVDAVLSFIGLEPGWIPPTLGQRFHEGGDEARFPKATRAVQRNRALQAVWDKVPADARRRFTLWFNFEANIRRGKRSETDVAAELDADLRARLADFYGPDVAVLEGILGEPVPWAELR
jgi:hypothetical protein